MADTCSGRLYEILDISKGATPSEVKKAYHKKALQYHPDKTGGTTTEEFKAIQEANAVLSDPEKRKLYDMFGRAGMARLEQFGMGGAAAGAMAHPLAIKFVAFIFFLVFFLCLLFVSLVVVKFDQDKSWSWAAVFTPVWILICPLAFTPCVFVAALRALKVREAFAALAGTGVFVCTILFVRTMDGHMESWKGFFYALFVTCTFYYISEALSLRLSYIKEMLIAQGHPLGPELTVTSPFYIRAVVTALFNFACNLSFFILMFQRMTLAAPDLSFYVIFAPLFASIAVPSLISMAALFLDSTTQLRHKLCMLLLGLLLLAATLYTYVMIAIKMQSDMNTRPSGGEGPNIKAAICAIMLFIFFGAMVLLSCCGCCCINVPSMHGAEGYTNVGAAEEGREEGATTAVANDEADPKQTSPIVTRPAAEDGLSKYNSLD